MNKDDAKTKLSELIKSAKIGMLTTVADNGSLQSRPMTMQADEFDGDLWFFTSDDSDKVREINAQPTVNVSFSEKGANSWVSVAGKAAVVHDKQKTEELWSPLLKAWFPDGTGTPGIALIRVTASSAEYWDAPHGAVVQLFGMAKAVLTGSPPTDVGENEETKL